MRANRIGVLCGGLSAEREVSLLQKRRCARMPPLSPPCEDLALDFARRSNPVAVFFGVRQVPDP